MKLSELVCALDGLRWDLHQWKIKEANANYYDDVLAEACLLINDLDR